VETVTTSIDTKGRKQPAKKAKKKKRPEHRLPREVAAPEIAQAAESIAPDELLLLREFARFVIDRTTVKTNPKDHNEWKSLLGKVKATLPAGGVS
jgi:hypothetical protein